MRRGEGVSECCCQIHVGFDLWREWRQKGREGKRKGGRKEGGKWKQERRMDGRHEEKSVEKESPTGIENNRKRERRKRGWEGRG